MKKAMAMLGCILVAVGLGLGWIGGRMGGSNYASVHLFGRDWDVYAPMAGSGFNAIRHATVAEHEPVAMQGLATSASTETGAFRNIDLDIEMGDVTVAAGDDYLIDISAWGVGYGVTWENDGGVLKVRSESGAVGTINCGSSVTIYVPADVLELVELDIDLGSVTLAGVTIDRLDVDLDLGELTGEGVTVLNGVTVDADLGSVTLFGDLTETVDISADLGDVTLCLARPRDEYHWDLSADLGSVTVDGVGNGKMSGSVTGGGGGFKITVEASLGSIQVVFDGEISAAIDEWEWATTDHGMTVEQEGEWAVTGYRVQSEAIDSEDPVSEIPKVPAAPKPPTPPTPVTAAE